MNQLPQPIFGSGDHTPCSSSLFGNNRLAAGKENQTLKPDKKQDVGKQAMSSGMLGAQGDQGSFQGATTNKKLGETRDSKENW